MTTNFTTICDYLRIKIFDIIKEDNILSIADLMKPYELIPDPELIVNYPKFKIAGDDDYLDFENFGKFIINNENSITFCCGGDWQDPRYVSLKIEKGKIIAYNIYEGYDDDDNWEEATLRIICELFGLDRKKYNAESNDLDDFITFCSDISKNKDFKLNIIKDISTEDCVKAIVESYKYESSELTNPKNWKRISKTGSGMYVRIFENRITKDKIKIISTKTEIEEIEKI